MHMNLCFWGGGVWSFSKIDCTILSRFLQSHRGNTELDMRGAIIWGRRIWGEKAATSFVSLIFRIYIILVEKKTRNTVLVNEAILIESNIWDHFFLNAFLLLDCSRRWNYGDIAAYIETDNLSCGHDLELTLESGHLAFVFRASQQIAVRFYSHIRNVCIRICL